MPPRKYSRLQFTAGIVDSERRQLLTPREKFVYQPFSDNIMHVVGEGEDLFHIAGLYYRSIPRGCGLWWVIADFQPEPIHDPTLMLSAGSVVTVPSIRTITEQVFSRTREQEAVP